MITQDTGTSLPATDAPPEETTAPMASPEEAILDSLALLDHRTRSRAIPLRLAPAGRYLALQDGDEQLLVPLQSKVTHIGRGLSSELRFEQHQVSRHHAIIVLHGRYARLLDNRSANGTFVNGREVVATNIEDGDVIRVGPVAMQYVVVR